MNSILALVAALIPALVLGTQASETCKENEMVMRMTDFITKTCTMHGAQDKIPQVMDAIEKLLTCSHNLAEDTKRIKSRANKHTEEDINEVVKQHCALAPKIRNCLNSLLDYMEVCDDKDEPIEKKNMEGARNLVDQLVNYACHKDGKHVSSMLNSYLKLAVHGFQGSRRC